MGYIYKNITGNVATSLNSRTRKDEKYTRISFVCYLREKIATCPDKIDSRFLTKSGHSKIKV